MNNKNTKIFIIDDDNEICHSLTLLLNSAGYIAESFSSAEGFIKSVNYKGPGCILLDVFLDGMSGMDFQEQIEVRNSHLPIIFMTGHGNISMSVKVLKKGAVNFLEKPIDAKDLLHSIEEAVNISKSILSVQNEIEKVKPLVDQLTSRELEVFKYVITGMLNKEIANILGIAEHTVKNHRMKISSKLKAKSVVEMIKIAELMNIGKARLPD